MCLRVSLHVHINQASMLFPPWKLAPEAFICHWWLASYLTLALYFKASSAPIWFIQGGIYRVSITRAIANICKGVIIPAIPLLNPVALTSLYVYIYICRNPNVYLRLYTILMQISAEIFVL